MMTTKTTKSLTPAFQFGGPNQSIFLGKNTITIQIDGKTYNGNGEVRLNLLPSAEIHIYTEFQNIPISLALAINIGQKKISSFTFGTKKVPGILLVVGGDENKQILQWRPKSEPLIGVGNATTSIQRLVFHLFNFKDIIGMRRTWGKNGPDKQAIEHVDLSDNSWRVELRSLVKTRDHFEKLRAEGGYGLTHIGWLKRPDESFFSGEEAEEELQALRFFLSFAGGMWCNPICAVGFDNSNTRVWELWSSPKEPWHSTISWFDPHHCEQIAGLFPGFMKHWEDQNWREAFHEVIYWYLNANNSSRGIDAGIILTQAAIERLSYEYAVLYRKLIEAKGFKDLRASDKFRLLFSSLDIPIDISTNTPLLGKLAKQFNWLDAPHAMTEVRNSLVHPEHKRHGQFGSVMFETWNLGLWYLELALLRICGYSGTYSNRLVVSRWVGQVEDVPWKKSAG